MIGKPMKKSCAEKYNACSIGACRDFGGARAQGRSPPFFVRTAPRYVLYSFGKEVMRYGVNRKLWFVDVVAAHTHYRVRPDHKKNL
jgi:hypothetical protein